jgi:phage tail tape-measure protein
MTSESDIVDNTHYVRVVLAHKDWLGGASSSAQFKDTLTQVRYALKRELAECLETDDDELGLLDLVAESLEESRQAVKAMLRALEHEDEGAILEALSAFAQATTALRASQTALGS